MLTLPGGIIISVLVLAYAMSGVELSHFLNFHSFVVVIVGTIAVLMLSSPAGSIVNLIKSLKTLLQKNTSSETLHKHLMKLIEDRSFKAQGHTHELIIYAQDLWEQGVEQHLFEELLEQRLDEMKMRSEAPVSLLKNLAKYPPALGMMGTVIGMVALFGNLNADNKNNIGANLALAMTATFYGLLLANMLITPLSDRLMVKHLEDVKRCEMIFNTLIFINRNEPKTIIEGIDTDYDKTA